MSTLLMTDLDERVQPDSVVARVEKAALRHPEDIAVVEGDREITYRELNDAAASVARDLGRLGIGRGDVVGVFLRRSVEMVVGILGVLKSGAAYAPQDARISPAAQLAHVATASQMKAVVTMSEFAERMPSGLHILFTDSGSAEGAAPAPSAVVDRHDACAVIFTSGTTGTPNGVVVTNGNLLNLLTRSPGDLGVSRGTRVGQILNIAFDMAVWETLGTLINGGTLVIRGREIAATACRVDVLIATPSVLATIPVSDCIAHTVVVAGERCPQALADEWASRGRFINSCGPTEITIVNTMSEHVVGAPVTIGAPVPGTAVYVLDENLQPVADGTPGEMWVGGAGVTAGYVNNPDLTAQRYRRDPFAEDGSRMFRTRDVGQKMPNGDLQHLGRTDDQVKIRGFRVELDSVSRILERAPGCVSAVTVKLSSTTLGAIITPSTVNIEDARRMVAANLPYYCVPEVVIAVDDVPLTARGKVDRNALVETLDRQRTLERGAA